jgi:hypothetical protein
MMFDDENLQVTFWRTNLPNNAVSSCHNPPRTDDGAAAYVWSRMPQWHLKLELTLSPNRNVLNDCIYLRFSPNQWLKLYRMFCKHLQNKRRILTGLISCKYYVNMRLIISLYGGIAGGWWTRKKSGYWTVIFYLSKPIPVFLYQLYMIIFVWHNMRTFATNSY